MAMELLEELELWRWLGSHLKQVRMLSGLTEYDVTSRMGMADDTVEKIEKGEKRIGVLQLIKLLRIVEG